MAEIKTTKTGSTQPRPDSLKSTGTNKSSSNIVGVHYKVGKKIGEGSFGVLYEGNLPPLIVILLIIDFFIYQPLYFNINRTEYAE